AGAPGRAARGTQGVARRARAGRGDGSGPL
ncbi:MAG: hypothetical protein AVDCRST_MAG11-2286, partial [uncultured Gemmatimonadaceae bacterium]